MVVKWPQSGRDALTYLSWLVRFDGYIDHTGHRVELYDRDVIFLRRIVDHVITKFFTGKRISLDSRGTWYRLRVYGKEFVHMVENHLIDDLWLVAAGLDAEGTAWFEGKYVRLAIYNKSWDVILRLCNVLNTVNIKFNIYLDKRFGVYRLRVSDQESVRMLVNLVGLRHPKFDKLIFTP